jgi:hypothetical protein
MKIAAVLVLVGSIYHQSTCGLLLPISMSIPKQRRKMTRIPLLVLHDSSYIIEVSRRTAVLTPVVVLASSTVCSTASLAGPSVSFPSSRIEALRNVRVITFLIPSSGAAEQIRSKFGSKSPVGSPSVLDAVQQLSRKATWFADGLVYTEIVPVPTDVMDDDSTRQVQDLQQSTNVLSPWG